MKKLSLYGERAINIPYSVMEAYKKYAINFNTEEEFNRYLSVLLDADETVSALLKQIDKGEHFYILDSVNNVNLLVEKTDIKEITIEFCIFNRKISFVPGKKGIKISRVKTGEKEYRPIIMGDHLGLSWFK